MRTSVVCVRGWDPRQDPMFTYVGRAVPRARWTGSLWGNPFMVGQTWQKAADFLVHKDREHMWTGYVNELVESLVSEPSKLLTGPEAVFCFRTYLDNHPGLTERLGELVGRKLGCWCVNWNPGMFQDFGHPSVPCHAVVLALAAEGRRNQLDYYLDSLMRGAGSCLTT